MNLAAAGPNWAETMTAFGTVGAVAAALFIALWSDWRTGQRLNRERGDADRRLSREQEHSDRLVREQREHDDQQLQEERRLAEARLQAERNATREREQLAEAYAVQVVLAEKRAAGQEPGRTAAKVLAAMVVNRGKYMITDLEAEFSVGGNMVTPHRTERVSGFPALPDELRAGWGAAEHETAMLGTLAPWDTGMRFESDEIGVQHLGYAYVVVRWTDHWGTEWEYKRGQVRPHGIGMDDVWMPERRPRDRPGQDSAG